MVKGSLFLSFVMLTTGALLLLTACEQTVSTETPVMLQPSESTRALDDALFSDIELLNIDGTIVEQDAYSGQGVILNIWATWCVPCRNEMPALNALSKKLLSKGIRVVAASVDSDLNLVKEFILKYEIDMEMLLINRNLVEGKSWLIGYPTTIFYNDKGELITVFQGEQNWLALDVDQYFTSLDLSSNAE